MKPRTHVTTVREWLELPEVHVPRIGNETKQGALLKINKVGFLIASPKDCRDAGVAPAVVAEGKCFLPTAVVEQNADPVLHRLPTSLLNWVIECVGLARAGNKLFPSEVEFGEINGQAYAEFCVARGAIHC